MGTRASRRTFGHFGGSGTFLWVDPEPGVGCVVLTERDFGEWAKELWPAFSDAVSGAGLANPSSSDVARVAAAKRPEALRAPRVGAIGIRASGFRSCAIGIRARGFRSCA